MLEQLSLTAAVHVAENMRAEDWKCLEAVTTITNPEVFALNRWQTDGAAWSLNVGRTPVAMGGISLSVPWVGVAWMVCTDRMSPASWKKLIRHASIVIPNAAKTVQRIEAHVLSEWPEAVKFARRLGFHLESTRYKAGRDGQNIYTFVYRGKPCKSQKSASTSTQAP